MKRTSKDKFIIVLNTINSLKTAEQMAALLVKEKLVACVNIIPKILSIYSWQKKVCKEKEFLMLMKTRQSLYSKLEKRILELHPYKVPEIIALTLLKGSDSYLAWLEQETVR